MIDPFWQHEKLIGLKHKALSNICPKVCQKNQRNAQIILQKLIVLDAAKPPISHTIGHSISFIHIQKCQLSHHDLVHLVVVFFEIRKNGINKRMQEKYMPYFLNYETISLRLNFFYITLESLGLILFSSLILCVFLNLVVFMSCRAFFIFKSLCFSLFSEMLRNLEPFFC